MANKLLSVSLDSAYSYNFLRSVVCLSVVCHIRALCLNRSTYLNAIWQEHLWGPVKERGKFGALNTPSQNMQLQIAAKPSVLCCHLANTNEELAIQPFVKLL